MPKKTSGQDGMKLWLFSGTASCYVQRLRVHVLTKRRDEAEQSQSYLTTNQSKSCCIHAFALRPSFSFFHTANSVFIEISLLIDFTISNLVRVRVNERFTSFRVHIFLSESLKLRKHDSKMTNPFYQRSEELSVRISLALQLIVAVKTRYEVFETKHCDMVASRLFQQYVVDAWVSQKMYMKTV